MPVTIEEAHEVTPALVDAFARLVPQLSRSSAPPTADELHEMVAAPGTHVLVALDEAGAIVGSLTLVIFRIPTGVRGWIEDVVVDESVRGQGVGDTLNRFALEVARGARCKTVDLTSRPHREAANRLYARIGFEQRDTNVYRFTLD